MDTPKVKVFKYMNPGDDKHWYFTNVTTDEPKQGGYETEEAATEAAKKVYGDDVEITVENRHDDEGD